MSRADADIQAPIELSIEELAEQVRAGSAVVAGHDITASAVPLEIAMWEPGDKHKKRKGNPQWRKHWGGKREDYRYWHQASARWDPTDQCLTWYEQSRWYTVYAPRQFPDADIAAVRQREGEAIVLMAKPFGRIVQYRGRQLPEAWATLPILRAGLPVPPRRWTAKARQQFQRDLDRAGFVGINPSCVMFSWFMNAWDAPALEVFELTTGDRIVTLMGRLERPKPRIVHGRRPRFGEDL
jgi:hypothetical protein